MQLKKGLKTPKTICICIPMIVLIILRMRLPANIFISVMNIENKYSITKRKAPTPPLSVDKIGTFSAPSGTRTLDK